MAALCLKFEWTDNSKLTVKKKMNSIWFLYLITLNKIKQYIILLKKSGPPPGGERKKKDRKQKLLLLHFCFVLWTQTKEEWPRTNCDIFMGKIV